MVIIIIIIIASLPPSPTRKLRVFERLEARARQLLEKVKAKRLEMVTQRQEAMEKVLSAVTLLSKSAYPDGILKMEGPYPYGISIIDIGRRFRGLHSAQLTDDSL